MCYSQIWQNFKGDEYLYKLGKEYLNASICTFFVYFFTAFYNFWRITRLFTTDHRWVINAQTGPFLLANPVQCTLENAYAYDVPCAKDSKTSLKLIESCI